jgi:hypothetical protein
LNFVSSVGVWTAASTLLFGHFGSFDLDFGSYFGHFGSFDLDLGSYFGSFGLDFGPLHFDFGQK